MEYFGYLRIPQYILQFTRGASGGISLGEMYILLGVAGALYLISLVLGGLALYVMAERAGVKHSWLGFIPFANTYYAGKVAGESPFLGKRMKRSGLYAMIAEMVYVAIEIMSLLSSILLASPKYYETNYVDGGGSVLIFNLASVPKGLRWMAGASTWFSVLSILADLVMILFLCAVYNSLFRKYSPRGAYFMTVFSVLLPVRAFLLFAVRNREPVDFDEYMKERIEQAMRSAGMSMPVQEVKPADPFSDFSDEPAASPFSEFDDHENARPDSYSDPFSDSDVNDNKEE